MADLRIADALYRVGALQLKLMEFPPYPRTRNRTISRTGDPVRYASINLALSRIEREGIPGSIAEVGVWKGVTSKFIHSHASERSLHLFDTFSGFPESDLQNSQSSDTTRFRDTSLERVKRKLGNTTNVIFHVGYFPETAAGLESERFALVMIDVDLYKPTVAALEFFYPRLERGGYAFLHDYNSPESDHAVRRAVDPFLSDKVEQLIELPDRWGSVVFRKS